MQPCFRRWLWRATLAAARLFPSTSERRNGQAFIAARPAALDGFSRSVVYRTNVRYLRRRSGATLFSEGGRQRYEKGRASRALRRPPSAERVRIGGFAAVARDGDGSPVGRNTKGKRGQGRRRRRRSSRPFPPLFVCVIGGEGVSLARGSAGAAMQRRVRR